MCRTEVDFVNWFQISIFYELLVNTRLTKSFYPTLTLQNPKQVPKPNYHRSSVGHREAITCSSSDPPGIRLEKYFTILDSKFELKNSQIKRRSSF